MANGEDFEGRLKKLETRFVIAGTIAAFLGISVGGLGGWVKVEEGRVKNLSDQIDKAKDELNTASQQQLALIKEKSQLMVEGLVQHYLAQNKEISGPYYLYNGAGPQDLMMPTDKGFCFLATVYGTMGAGAGAYVRPEDGRWKLTVTSQNAAGSLQGGAICVKN